MASHTKLGAISRSLIAVLTTSHLIKTYIISYARPHLYSTALTYADIIAIETSFEYISSPAGAEVGCHMRNLSLLVFTSA